MQGGLLRRWTQVALALSLSVTVWLSEASGQRPAWTTSRLKGMPTAPPEFALRPAFPQRRFEKPTSLEEMPGGRLLVTEIGGNIYSFAKQDPASAESDRMLSIAGASLWHATLHPEFAENGRLFVCYSKDGTSNVSEFAVEGDPPRAVASSEIVHVTWPAGGHNAGCLRFGTDGMLYIATGDGSGPNPPDGRTAGQDITNLFGCILRINVDQPGQETSYSIPADNPFVDTPQARGEIWAYGLRNPWKFGVDSQSGRIFVADNGWESWEMVHEIVRGANCGWPIMEGRAILRSEVERGPTEIRPPVKDHPHSEANSVVGGPIYRGNKLSLNGTFVYGDYITGTIWGLRLEDDGNFTHRTLVDTDQRIVAFAQGKAGELYVLDYDLTGQIYELVPSGLTDQSADFPRALSETGIFHSLKELRPAVGVIPYGVNAPRWMDGYRARRFVAIPGDGRITLAEGDQPPSYPEGTVFVKHLVLATGLSREVPVETQVLHYENGTWHPYTYAWNDVALGEEWDAQLVDAVGADRQVVTGTAESGGRLGPTKHFSAVNECRLCHNAGSGYVLGFNAAQLDGGYFATPRLATADQLERLQLEKTISPTAGVTEDDPSKLVDPHDESYSLDDRARSYLHANCSACHHPGGNAIVSFYLRRDMPFDELNTYKGTGIGTFGMRNAKLIVPGDPYRSVLLYRMSKLGYGRMPYIGSRAVDSRGVALIERWIREMPKRDPENDSPLVQPDSDEAEALRRAAAIRFPLLRPDQYPVDLLVGSTEGALGLAAAIHAGRVSPNGAQQVYESTPSDVRGLFEDFVPPALRRKTLGPAATAELILPLEGDVNRGKLIFFSDGARCRNCHHSTDAHQSIGPTLSAIRKKYTSRSDMLQHVLKPSLKVDEPFAMWIVTTVDGRVLRGLIVENTDDHVILKTAEKQVVKIGRREIDELLPSKQSLMPQGILADLTAQEAADLLSWLTEKN